MIARLQGELLECRGVAQPGRAPGSGPGGRRFKSSLPDQLIPRNQWIRVLVTLVASATWVHLGPIRSSSTFSTALRVRRYGVQIDLPCDLCGRVPQQRLHRSQRRAHRVEQRRVRMSQPMPSDTLDAELLARRRKLTIEKISSTERRAAPGCKHERFRIDALRLESRQHLDSLCTERYCPLAPPGLGIVEPALINGLPYSKAAQGKINVAPTKCKQLADTQPGQNKQPGQRPRRLRKSFE